MATGPHVALGRQLQKGWKLTAIGRSWGLISVTWCNLDSHLTRRAFTPHSTDDNMEGRGFPKVVQIHGSRMTDPAAASWNSWQLVAQLSSLLAS